VRRSVPPLLLLLPALAGASPVIGCDDGYDVPGQPYAWPRRLEPPPAAFDITAPVVATAPGPRGGDPPGNACGGEAAIAPVGAPCGQCGTVACAGADLAACAGGPAAPCAAFETVLTADTPPNMALNDYGAGVAFGDIDGDGAADVLFGGVNGVRAFRGDGAGGFEAVLGPIVDPVEGPSAGPVHVSAVTLADVDGDGDDDLFLTAEAPAAGMYLYTNDGTGAFADASALVDAPALSSPSGVAWGDYDGDGWLDAFVAGAFGSALLHNDGGAGLEDVAPALGVVAADHFSCQPLWVDYDLDHDLDLFVANDRGPVLGLPPLLYRNDGGALTDVAVAAGITGLPDGMGVAAGDFEDDGDVDFFVTSIGWDPVVGAGQFFFVNQGDGTFVEEAHLLGAAAPDRYGWGATFLDYDDDGDLDLAFAAHADPLSAGSWLGENWGGGFLDVTGVAGGMPALTAHGIATADVDGDGRLDLAFATKDGFVAGLVLRNAVATPGHWLRVRVTLPAPNAHAIGATVFVDAGGVRRMRAIDAGSAYLSASEPVAHFGLGAASTVDGIEVWLPDGTIVLVPGPLPADQLVEVAP